MLKVLFGRYSRVIRLVEAVALVLTGVIVYGWWKAGSWDIPDALYSLLLLQYAWIRFCYFYPWYPAVKSQDPEVPELGIEIHFVKALVPTSYILAATALLSLLGLAWPATILANLMMFVVSGVNVILVWFHFHDKDPLPVNFFTRSLILLDETAATKQAGHEKHLVQVSRAAKGERSIA